ncbi:MAG: hypothetical protein KKA22_13840 [Gammaproteobacteria bacterium]|nr:hypothetical protein [Gammaproteobacteria bacterium]MBU1409217.1 hypothetical protein [Gammaproteobacteria bacterium]MBU1531113.1 hypothetical protein [Gammaproteobacteria bacterium]
MKPSQPPAENSRSRDPTEEPAAEESVFAHAKRALGTRVRARITAVVDAAISVLQKLRPGGVPEPKEDEDRPRARSDRPRDRDGTPPAEAAAPKPKRRLRALLIYLGVMLVGGMGGGALAYVQFQKQLGLQLEESQRLEAALAKKTRPSADIRKAFEDEQARRTAAEKKLAATLAEYGESTSDSYALLENLLGEQLAESRRMEAALADSEKSTAEALKALADEQAKRTETEAKLASTLDEYAKSGAESQKRLDAAERQLAGLVASGGDSGSTQRETPVSRHTERSRPRTRSVANCNLDTKNVDALKSCIEEFNR